MVGYSKSRWRYFPKFAGIVVRLEYKDIILDQFEKSDEEYDAEKARKGTKYRRSEVSQISSDEEEEYDDDDY